MQKKSSPAKAHTQPLPPRPMSHNPAHPASAKLIVGVCIGRVDSLGSGAVSLKPSQLVFFDTTVHARDNPTTIMLQGWIAQEETGGQKLEAYWRRGAFAQ